MKYIQRPTRYNYFLFIFIFIFCNQLFGQDKHKNDLPNFIILFCDDLGYGDIGSYGHPTIKTPNIDKMAGEGMKFTSFYTGSPACTASRYSLLTGRFPVMSGFGWVLYPKSEKGIHPKEFTMAEALKEKGYTTGMFGKWHLGSTKKEYLPLQNGFDEYIGFPYSNDMIPPKWPSIPLLSGNDTLELDPDQRKLTGLYTQKAIEFIQQNKKKPFFVYMPYAMPHVPLHPGEQFAGKSQRGKYGDVVEEIDWSVGEIIKAVKKAGVAENTLIWFTSDNGPWLIKNDEGGSAGLLRDGKGSTWEGGMRVPSVAFWPGKIQPNSVNSQLTSTLDLYVTFLGLAGINMPTDRIIDGKDISGYLFPNKKMVVAPKSFFYYGFNQEIFAVRKGSWKLHIKTYSQLKIDYFNGEIPLLFNVDTDPSEKYNVAAKHPEIVKELLEEIEKQNNRVAAKPDYFTEMK